MGWQIIKPLALHDRQITQNNFVRKEKEANSSVNISHNFPWFA